MDTLLHEDLTTVESITPFLKQCVGKGKEIPPGSLLQIQQITNISFPTYDKPNYESDKHTLKLTVTDGQSQGYAIIHDSCPGISLNTPPGTKLRITQAIPVQASLFVLTRNNCEVLGGRVVKLYEKWEVQKKMAIKHEWGYTGSSVEGEGPPPWKPFGYKPSIDVAALRKMKAMDVVNEKRDEQSNPVKTQFDVQRNEAISELQATANKQKFQKPNKHLLDKEITDIMDEGFSQSEAEYAMKRFKNPQKALKHLKDSKTRQDGPPKEFTRPVVERKDRRKKGKGMDDEDEQDVPVEYQRPNRSISLFGFIEGHIKSDSDKDKPSQTNGPALRNQGDRSRNLDDDMGRLNIRDSHNEFHSGRGERGRGRGYRGSRGGSNRDSFQQYDKGGGNRDSYQKYDKGGGNRDSFQHYDKGEGNRDSYQKYDKGGGNRDSFQQYDKGGGNRDSFQQYDKGGGNRDSFQQYDKGGSNRDSFQQYDKGGSNRDSFPPFDKSVKSDTHQKPPRFQNRGGPESRVSDYQQSAQRSERGGGYDNYRGYNKDSYDTGSKEARRPYTDNASYRQDYSGNYPSQNQQRVPSGKESSYSSEHNQHQYSHSNEYPPVPSHNYQQSFQQMPPRQYANAGPSNHQEPSDHRTGGPQRAPHNYPNHSSGNHGVQQPPNEFSHYQYGYEEWNPTQSLVFTRSKPETRGGRGVHAGTGRAANTYNSAGRSYQSNRY